MTNRRASRRKAGFLKHHALSLTAIGIVLSWLTLYIHTDPKTHRGSFFGNAIADWTGVLVTVLATKYFYEIGSAESRQPGRRFRNRAIETVRDHSLTIFLVLTGAGLDTALPKDGFRREVGTGRGKHRVRVDATPGACPPD